MKLGEKVRVRALPHLPLVQIMYIRRDGRLVLLARKPDDIVCVSLDGGETTMLCKAIHLVSVLH